MLRGFHDSPCVERPSTTKTLKFVKHHYWCPHTRDMSLDAFLVRILTYEIFCYLGLLQLVSHSSIQEMAKRTHGFHCGFAFDSMFIDATQ